MINAVCCGLVLALGMFAAWVALTATPTRRR